MRKDEFPLIEAYADSKVNEVLAKILKEIADLKAKDVMKELNRERTAAFEWTKHDIYRIVEKAKAEEGEKDDK